MDALETISHKRKNTVIHIVVGILSGLFFVSENLIHNSFSAWKMLETSLIVITAYFHALILIPYLLKTKEINKYILFTFGLFSSTAIIISIIRIALKADYIFIFKKLLYHGPALGLSIENLYKNNFYIALSLFSVSLIYGLLTSEKPDKLKYIGNLIFGKNFSELLIHIILLLLLLTTSYFAGFFPSNLFIICILLFYSHLIFASPFLLKKKKINKFILVVIIEILAFCSLSFFLTNIQFALLVSVSVTTMTFSTIYAFIKLQFKENEFLIAKKSIELQQLKSQINPHFLFNALNTVYSTALKENAEKTAQNIKKLSNLIRFILSDIEKDLIPLEKEVNYIKDYIDIQLARCSSKQNIIANFTNIGNVKIAPMLLVPFVENSFKHGINPNEESSLFLNVEYKKNTILFECRNSLKKTPPIEITEQGFGIGIENVKSRLKLIYPNKHSISISKKLNEYSVKLEINDNSNCN